MIAKGYISSRKFMGERVPQTVQNLVLRNYCKNNNIIFELSSTEYAMEESFYVLNQLLNNKKYKCIIFYSLFQLPYDENLRKNILKNIIKTKKNVIFALENIFFKDEKDLQQVENIWFIKKISKICLTTKELKKIYAYNTDK